MTGFRWSSWRALVVAAAVVVGGRYSWAHATLIVSDVNVVGGLGTVTVAEPDGVPHPRITRDGGRAFHRLKVGGRSDVTATVLSNGLGYAKAGNGRLWRTSVDAGRTFVMRSRAPLPGVGAPAVGRLIGAGHIQGFSALADERAFMSFGYEKIVSPDGGRTWRALRHLPRRLDGGLSALSIDGKDRYLALGGDGLWKSSDAGARWRRLELAEE